MFDSICTCRRRPWAKASHRRSESSRAMSRQREFGHQARPRQHTRRHRHRWMSMPLVPKEKVAKKARPSGTGRISGAALGTTRAKARRARTARTKEKETKVGFATPAVAGVTLRMLVRIRRKRVQQRLVQRALVALLKRHHRPRWEEAVLRRCRLTW